MTDCTILPLAFQDLGSHKVLSDFDRGISPPMPALFFFANSIRISDSSTAWPLAPPVSGIRRPDDHGWLRQDPLLTVLVGKTNPTGYSSGRQERSQPAGIVGCRCQPRHRCKKIVLERPSRECM